MPGGGRPKTIEKVQAFAPLAGFWGVALGAVVRLCVRASSYIRSRSRRELQGQREAQAMDALRERNKETERELSAII